MSLCSPSKMLVSISSAAAAKSASGVSSTCCAIVAVDVDEEGCGSYCGCEVDGTRGCPVSVLVAEAYGPSQEEVLSSCRHGELWWWVGYVQCVTCGEVQGESRVELGKGRTEERERERERERSARGEGNGEGNRERDLGTPPRKATLNIIGIQEIQTPNKISSEALQIHGTRGGYRFVSRGIPVPFPLSRR